MRGRFQGLQRIPKKPLYTEGELARHLGVSLHIVRKLLRTHAVDLLRAGRYNLVPLDEIRDKLPAVWRSVEAVNE